MRFLLVKTQEITILPHIMPLGEIFKTFIGKKRYTIHLGFHLDILCQIEGPGK